MTKTPEIHVCHMVNPDPLGCIRIPNVLFPITWRLECTPKIFMRGDTYYPFDIRSCDNDIYIYNECWLDDGDDLSMGLSYEYAMNIVRQVYIHLTEVKKYLTLVS